MTTPLTPEEERIIVNKGTERPFSGEYDDFFVPGVYHCRRCNTALYTSNSKFDAHCGWPAFDQAIPDAVTSLPDADGTRTEIQCTHCGAHLGHVFTGEKFTPTDTRHCVNSLSMHFVPYETVVLGGGCFWCTEAIFSQLKGVLHATPGYAGGHTPHPTYEQVCTGKTGHAETVQVVFDPAVITLTDLLEVFFATHDPTTANQQGADTGPQYRSIILTTTTKQQQAVATYVAHLQEDKTFKQPVVTTVESLDQFYPAEVSHQEYYQRNPHAAYCQIVISPKLTKLRKTFARLTR